MNKLITVLAIFAFSSSYLFGQGDFEGEITWGDPIKVSRKESAPMPIGSTTSSFYSRKQVKKKMFVQKFGLKSLKLEKESELDLDYKGFDLMIVNDFVYANRVVFITSYIDKKAKKQHYLMHEFEDDKKLGKPVELAVTEWSKRKIILSKKALEKLNGSSAYSFDFIVSDDYETMMVSYQNADGDTETVLFDDDMEEVGRATIDFPFENFMRTTGLLTNSGRFYMVGHDFELVDGKGLLNRNQMEIGDYYILIHDAVNGDMESVELDIDKEIISLGVKVLPDESTVAYGMYSNESANGVSGAFFQKLDTDFKVEFTTLEEFEENFITQFWTERQKRKADRKKKSRNPKKKAEPSLYSYIMHDLAIKDNGDMVLLGEQYFMYVTTSTTTDANGNMRTTYTYHYIYNDIIAVNCTKSGEVTWKEKVKKRQHSVNDGGYYSSFHSVVQGNNLFLMYNDKEGNMDDAEEATNMKERRELKKDNVAALISFTAEGETARKTLFDFEGDESRNLVPKRCLNLGPEEIFLFAEMGRRTKILGLMNL